MHHRLRISPIAIPLRFLSLPEVFYRYFSNDIQLCFEKPRAPGQSACCFCPVKEVQQLPFICRMLISICICLDFIRYRLWQDKNIILQNVSKKPVSKTIRNYLFIASQIHCKRRLLDISLVHTSHMELYCKAGSPWLPRTTHRIFAAHYL